MPEREHPRGRQSAEEISDLAVRLHERVRDGGPLAAPADVAASLHPEDAAELEAILRVLAALDGPAPDLADPPPHLWGRIAAELEPETEAVAHDGPGAGDATDVGMRPGGVAAVRPIGSARSVARGRWWPLAAAAAVGLVIGGGAVGAAMSGGPWQGGAPEAGKPAATSPAPPTPAPPTPVSPTPASPTSGTDAPGQGAELGGGEDLIGTAVMASVTTDGSAARAEMTRAADGEMHLAVHVPQVPAPEDGYLEVWIRDEAATRMISLGTVTRQDSVLTVPEGVDLASYPMLDVSHEHFDGDPSHSTISLWVGEMRRAT
ncbi:MULTISPECIES: hypothetical protein [Micrococcus]|uniref:hypothetical protein n=1 Tax=Micrococcus antarcticus TaxID=86171 RepID=UPI00384E1E11